MEVQIREQVRENSQQWIVRVLALSMATLMHAHARNPPSVALGLISYDIATWTFVFPADTVFELPNVLPSITRFYHVT